MLVYLTYLFNVIPGVQGVYFSSLLGNFFFLQKRYRKKLLILPFIIIVVFFIRQILYSFDYFELLKTYIFLLINFYSAYFIAQHLVEILDINMIKKIVIVMFSLFFFTAILLIVGVDGIMWHTDDVNQGLMTGRFMFIFYEPAHFGYNFIPIALLVYIFYINKRISILYVFASLILIGFTFSLGVIFSLIGAFLILLVKKLLSGLLTGSIKKNWVFLSFITFIICGSILFTNNKISNRFNSFIQGTDHSGLVRTTYSLYSANNMIKDYNIYWGVGAGQVDLIAKKYTGKFPGYGTHRLPSSVSGTLAGFGYIGLMLRFCILIALFIYTRTYSSDIRLLLFCFLLIFQFGGSYVTNFYEYVGWTLAFTPLLDKKIKYS